LLADQLIAFEDTECERCFCAGHECLSVLRELALLLGRRNDRRETTRASLQVFGRLDDLGDEVLANPNERRVLREVASIDGRALRLDQVTFDGVTREVVDLDLAAASRITTTLRAALGLRDC